MARYKAFVEHYISNGQNATEAAIAAGYSAKTACSQGSRLLTNVEVEKLLEGRIEKSLSNLSLTTDRILQELARVAFFDPRKLLNIDGTVKKLNELDDDTAAAIASLEVETTASGAIVVKTRACDKMSAIEKAMRYRGLFKDAVPLPIPQPLPAEVRHTVELKANDKLMALLGIGARK